MKTQLFDLTHTTTYDYHSAVTLSHHLLHVTPRRLPRQFRLEHHLEIDPAASSLSQRTDYFGNETTFATIEGTHRRLRITSRSRIAVGPAFIPDPAETPPWENVRGLCRSDRSAAVLEAIEFTFPTALVPLERSFATYALASFTPRNTILTAALDLTARIHADFQFDATATSIATPLPQVMQQRRGVCQDFAHVQIACLRSLGLPARYVSGYLETIPPPGKPRLVGADASHAWISLFCPGLGWIDLDPTNNCFPSLRHITVAWGRDYSDVSPVRGVLLGSGEHTLSVAVDVVPRGSAQLYDDTGGDERLRCVSSDGAGVGDASPELS
jgi:transglutaminase-like putative cysteine protease